MGDPELDELKREFLAEAQEKVAEMQSTLDRARTDESIDRLIYLAHQLKGSGGSYGFQKISTEAAELEKAVEAIKEAGTGDGFDGSIKQYVVNLNSEIERGTRELSLA